MIISYSKKFVYLRTVKVASSSLEFFFAQFCNKNDVITPLLFNEERQKKKYKILTKQNYKYLKFSLSIKNILKFNIFKHKRIDEHSTIDTVFKTNLGKNIRDYFFFSFVRNPYNWIVSYFWWDFYYHKKKSISYINSLSEKQIKYIFKRFLIKECKNFFIRNKKIISSNYVKINIYKLENLNKNLLKIKKRLNLKNQKIDIFNIKLKNLKITKKIKLDKDDKNIILNEAEYFFKRFNYGKRLPKKYL